MNIQNFVQELYKEHNDLQPSASPELIHDFVRQLLGILFPELSNMSYKNVREFHIHYQQAQLQFLALIPESYHGDAEQVEQKFFHALPDVRTVLLMDADALVAGDPAAQSRTEVIRTYPGFFALAVHRLAHVLYQLQVPLMPRVFSEYAHSLTGIDIHPGATIGSGFCIDHGTGVVIGETCHIGKNVKMYQGVTLGALSVDKSLASTKRHPTVEDNVVIYAGATILGGDTVIGRGSVIGGNVWITRSIDAGSTVYYKGHKHQVSRSE